MTRCDRTPHRCLTAASLTLALALALVVPAHAHDGAGPEIAAATRALAVDPRDVDALVRRAELHRISREWFAAEADLAAARRIAPGRPDIDLCAAALAFDRGAPAAALPGLERYLARRPEAVAALRLRARVQLALSEPALAVADFNRAMAADVRHTPDDYLERAAAQQAAGADDEEVREGLEEGIEELGDVVSLVLPADALAAVAEPDGDVGFFAWDEAGEELEVEENEPTAALPPPPIVRAPPNAAAPSAPFVGVPRFATWRYLATPEAPSADWIQPAYDDAGWPAGAGPLGYGDPYIVTTVPFGGDGSNRWPTTYFRQRFDLGVAPSTVWNMNAYANYDDGFVLYLNGTEIARRAMPAGPVVYTTLATNHEGGGYEFVDLFSWIGLLVPGENVLAVELHQTTVNSTDLGFDLQFICSTTGTALVRGPYLQVASPTGVTVRWRTNVATPSEVCYGTDPLSLTCVSVPAVVTEHEVVLSGLSPATRYFYNVGTGTQTLTGGDSATSFVTTPPNGFEGPTRAWIIGDAGTGTSNAAAVRNAFLQYTGDREADVWLMLGDNAYTAGTDAEYQAAVFDMYPDQLRRWPVWPTRGNHEVLYGGPGNDYYDIFTLPTAGEAGGPVSGTESYYAFDHGNVHFVCLDSEGTDRSPGGAMAVWLAADLAANTLPWTIAFWHHPPYTKGSHDSDNDSDSGGRMRDMRANMLPILEAAGVDLVLTGHSHSYERSCLLDGHYGPSATLTPAMRKDPGDGRPDGNGEYAKSLMPTAHEGAVYAVAGSSGQIQSGGTLSHPVMITSLLELGSMVVDVTGPRLDARFIGPTGVVRDSFTIVKSPPLAVPHATVGTPIRLQPVRPNPSGGATSLSFTLPTATRVRITVVDAMGRERRVITNGDRPAGRNELHWDGRDAAGQRLPSGVYFVTIETREGTGSRKFIRLE